jgi:6-phosphofructokinase 1
MGDAMRIAVLTSGGDSPGMNAAIRSIAMCGAARGHEVVGVRRGYAGLLEGDLVELRPAAVDGITRLGGSILGSARTPILPTTDGLYRARERLVRHRIDALVVIGGNGSLTGAHRLAEGGGCRILGLPASIDNDIGHTSLAVGVDTAVNTIVEACDRISDTARAHRRAFLVEVMGRQCGFLAMRAGIAAEADAILYAERGLSEDEIVARLRGVLRNCFAPGRGKTRALIVKSEGVKIPTSTLVARLREHLEEDASGVELRETILGHVVRGGSPGALDRLIAQRLGFTAVLEAERDAHDVLLGWEVPDGHGEPTQDPAIRKVLLADALRETARLVDGTSPVVQRRVALLEQVENLLAF